jgi:DNA-binding transcriptional ArsR family regulator
VRDALIRGPLTWKRLVEQTKLPGPTVHHALRRLKEKGLVSTALSERDEVLWALTSVGVVSSFVGYLEEIPYTRNIEITEDKLFTFLHVRPLTEWTDEEWKTDIESFLHHVNTDKFAQVLGTTLPEFENELLALLHATKPNMKRIWDFVFGQFNASVANMVTVYFCALVLMQKLQPDQRERILENLFDRDLLPSLSEAFERQLMQFAYSLFLGRPAELPT